MISIILGTYARPLRTRRAIYCLLEQTHSDWELLVVGDGCPVVQDLMDKKEIKDERVKLFNLYPHVGSAGHCVTFAIKEATKPYIAFIGNDDIVSPNHVEKLIDAIETHPDANLLFFNTQIQLGNMEYVRFPILQLGRIGHSEIVVRTDIARQAPEHQNAYNHDWYFIQWILQHSPEPEHGGYAYIDSEPTYTIRHIPGNPTLDTID